MNVLALNYQKLPTPLRTLNEQERSAFEAGISPFLSPLNHLAALVKSCAQDLRDENRGLYFKLVGAILGLERFKLSPGAAVRFIPVLAEYISERGTRRSLEIITKSVLGAEDFDIQERTYPYRAMLLGSVLSGQRLTTDDHDTMSITIRFSQKREAFQASDLAAYRQLLSQELPPDMAVYLIFRTEHEKPIAPEYCAIVGERLL